VIYSHSSARALVDHPRDVPDDILRLVAANGGVVMVNFNPGYVSQDLARWEADEAAEMARYNSPPYGGLYIGQPERAKAALDVWLQTHPEPVSTLEQVADHIEHIRDIAGVDHVGLGSDFDGITETPRGLGGVDRFPALLEELLRRGWSDADVAKVAGGNLLRVMAATEQVAMTMRGTTAPGEGTLEKP
jgi:membrane dipeptidase